MHIVASYLSMLACQLGFGNLRLQSEFYSFSSKPCNLTEQTPGVFHWSDSAG